ncbi:MAG TPA: 50S ribosomal protein L15 [Acidimicrobiales bacterium]|nr:50S ribosomal protein L15 [Acidimicrobiales bacterium]
MKIHDLQPAPGSNKRKKRVGRGIAGKGGKTAGRGTKGQKARGTVPAWFEGGQMPLHMRVPKLKGFNNPFRVEYQAINLDTIEASELTEVTPETLHAKGLTHKGALVKILGRGELTRAVTVKAHAFSKSAEAAITAAGGTVEVLPKPWGDRRPPVKGNQFANR